MVKQHYKIGLVTASPRHNLDWLQTLIDLDSLFENIISGDETEKNKPHPAPYLAMMSKLEVTPTNTVVIEDSLNGIQSALASGASVIAKTGSVPESDLSIAHRIVTHLDQITHNMIEELLQETK
jgi:beta-phosphoglucomutase-like phosphatase (HAD superfamily)